MNTDLLYREETHKIIGCAMEVLNTLGHGFHEKPYENALCAEFALRQIPHVQQPRFDMVYKNYKVGEFIPDLVVWNKIIVGTKTVESIGEREIGQMLNYLKITGLKVGLIINFKHPKLYWERVVH